MWINPIATHALVILFLFYRCFGDPCEWILFETTYTEWQHSVSFDCAQPKHTFRILSPAYHRKSAEDLITVWIWVKAPLHNTPFGHRQKKEFVYIPTDKFNWNKPWYHIELRITEETASSIEDVILKKVILVNFKTEKGVSDIHKSMDFISVKFAEGSSEFEAVKAFKTVKGGDISQLDDIIKEKAVNKEAIEQLEEYVNRLFRIRDDINRGLLHETVTAKRVILTHPHHSRYDNNQWVLARFTRGGNIMSLPFIGKSIAAESEEAFTLEAIATHGIDLDKVTETNLKFGKFTAYGFSFTLKTKTGEKNYEIYWYQQVYGGCVFHSLRSVLQKEGESLTAGDFNEYSTKIAKPCSYCGREDAGFVQYLYEQNIGALKSKQECRMYNYCGTEVYLMEHKYHLLQLNMVEVRAAMKRVPTDSGLDPKDVFEHIMIGAFKQLFKSNPHFLFVADSTHAWTYMKMNTICDIGGYWLSLDSNNYGAIMVYDILYELKKYLLTEGLDPDVKYTIYGVYPQEAEAAVHKIENLWIPQQLREATCDKDKGDTEPFLGNYIFDNDAVNQVLLIMAFLVFCFSLLTISGCICGFYGEDVLKKAFAQSEH